ncbi:MAG: GtrA family protein [Methylococcales bacterium]|nr:GtrA family protein [Methylococcales bacterium]
MAIHLNRQFLKFLLVGGSTGIVQFLVLFLALDVLLLSYQLASIIAYVISLVFHYTLNRMFTFKASGKPDPSELFRYGIMIAGNALITFAITICSVEVLQLGVYVGTILAISVTVGITFLTSKYWVFRSTTIYEGMG